MEDVKLEVQGSAKTMNLEPQIYTKVISSIYFKEDLYNLKSVEETIQRMESTCTSIEVVENNGRVPGTALCLIYKLFCFKLTEKQVTAMLQHPDSNFVRACGILYLRYVCPPHRLFEFLQPYFNDNEVIQTVVGTEVTIGQFIVDLIVNDRYLESLLPRLPTKVLRELTLYFMKNNMEGSHPPDREMSAWERQERRKIDRAIGKVDEPPARASPESQRGGSEPRRSADRDERSDRDRDDRRRYDERRSDRDRDERRRDDRDRDDRRRDDRDDRRRYERDDRRRYDDDRRRDDRYSRDDRDRRSSHSRSDRY